ncbi:MAG: hypothetical protein A2521_13685 [Deltaproteobacteria bacterium RIFOXYD12_FULL_57_12]|nr:MAG: hypothetical protein A2521_13685 [Deltaproteobacteria bacterium RIFOXYD12_FULL_57_12]
MNNLPENPLQAEKKTGTVAALLKRMAEQRDFPAISKYISEINEKAAPGSSTSAAQLAAIIIKDYALTTKLLKMVNSASYGQFAGQIATVSRAVVILGFEQVRMAATGLVFFEHLHNLAQAAAIKKTILASFLSGIYARGMAPGMRITDIEDLFICCLLHNFGKLLLMYYFPGEYARVEEMMAAGELQEKEAIRSVFGCADDEIGMAIAETWGLPQKIITSMKGLARAEIMGATAAVDDFRKLACFSNELYNLAARALPANEKRQGLQAILRKYEKIVPTTEKKVLELMDTAAHKAKEYYFVMNITPHQEELVRQMSLKETPAPAQPVPGAPPVLDLARFQVGEAAAPAGPASTTGERQILFMNGFQEVTQAMLDDSFSLDDIINMVVETAYRGLGFSRVLFSIKDPKTNTMNGRFGLGSYIDEVLRKFRFPIQAADDFFNLALAHGQDFFVDDTASPQVAAAIPAWYRGILKAPAFALFPLMVNNTGIGLLYADMKESGEPISSETLNYLKMLRNQIVLAIKQRSRPQ